MIDEPILLLAGGLGTRLSSVLGAIPKPLAPIGNRSFLDLLLEDLHLQGATRVILSLHHGINYFNEYLNNCSWSQKLKIETVVEPELLGTGGACRFAIQELGLSGPLLIGNADTYIPGAYREIARAPVNAPNRIGLVHVDDHSRYGTVEFGANHRVTGFIEKQPVSAPGWIYSGICRLRAEDLAEFEGQKFSMEREFFPSWISQFEVTAIQLTGSFIDIGIPSDYKRFTALLSS